MPDTETVDATDLPPIKTGAGGYGAGQIVPSPAPGTDTDSPSGIPGLTSTSGLVGPSGSLTYDALRRTAESDAASAKLDARLDRDRAERDRAYKAESSGPDSLPPKWDAAAERAKTSTGPMEAFGSVGMIFALAASAFTKAPMTSALKAGGAVLEAIHSGDEERYKSAYEAWKDNTELALKRFQMERELFDDANKLSTSDVADWRTKQQEIAARFDNHKVLVMLENGMDKDVIDIQNAQVKGAVEMATAKDKMEDFNNKYQILEAEKQAFMQDNGIDDPKDLRVIQHALEVKQALNDPATSEQQRLMKDFRNDYWQKNHAMPSTDEEIKAWQQIQQASSSKSLSADQEFIRRFYEENPNATADELTKAFGDFKNAQKDTARTEEISRHNKAMEDISSGRLSEGLTKEQETERHNKAMEAIATGKQGGAPGKGPEAVAAIADGIKSGNQPPILTGLYGMSGPVRAKLQEDGFDLSKAQIEWQRAQKQVATLNGPQMTRFVGLASSVQNTIDEVNGLAKEMDLGGIPAKNSLELKAFMQAEGNSKNGQLAARYIAAVNTLKEEFANLANGGYAPTEPAWALANQQIDGNFGVKQLGASLSEIRRLINYRIQGVPGLSKLGAGAPNRYTGAEGGPTGDGDWTTLPNGDRVRVINK